MIKPALFDVVELLIDLPDQKLFAGMQGTLVEEYGKGIFEVEFSDDHGQTFALCTLNTSQFCIVWQASTKNWIKSSDQLMVIVNYLSESRQQEVLDFARFLYKRQQITSQIH